MGEIPALVQIQLTPSFLNTTTNMSRKTIIENIVEDELSDEQIYHSLEKKAEENMPALKDEINSITHAINTIVMADASILSAIQKIKSVCESLDNKIINISNGEGDSFILESGAKVFDDVNKFINEHYHFDSPMCETLINTIMRENGKDGINSQDIANAVSKAIKNEIVSVLYNAEYE